ncbi:hypothetical protein AB9R81_11710 [Vibrio cyclitrophicus]
MTLAQKAALARAQAMRKLGKTKNQRDVVKSIQRGLTHSSD